uniref:uncharacterized protein LOC108951121 n=1 Tax=Ciona intestinalis TaxID=7719 RepID=UPI00089DB410|nr:uncharacterized protein LOC108951121 [Ciona intestinalis]|eukprot:XP_018673414.1 uncharacterized protein LOC108951121 [Ciona intestinalis]
MWIKLSILLACISEFIAADTCNYKRYPTSFIPNFITRNNVTTKFSTLSSAKEACDHLGENCFGVVLVLHMQYRLYVIGSSSDIRYNDQAISWRKTCPGDCEFVLSREFNGRSVVSKYNKICDTVITEEETSAQGGTWLPWSRWSPCSHSCGENGVKRRVRQCRVNRLDRDRCSGNRTQTAPCNYSRKCPITLSDVYGIVGPEGIAIAGRIPIYSSCIRQEAGNRTGCGHPEGITTREKCRQFNCCYLKAYTGPEQGPRCYQPIRIYGGAGPSGWSIWSGWSVCSKSCRNGTRSRNRVCTGGLPGSIICPQSDTNIEVCSLGPCPCDVNPCRNDGVCIVDARRAHGYRCECPNNLIGKHCDFAEPVLTCLKDSITVSFDKRVIEDEGLLNDPDLIHFSGYNSSLCYATPSPDGLNYQLSIPPPIDRNCGSSIKVTGEEYTVRNKVIWRLADSGATSSVVLLDLACVYDKKPNATTGLGFGIQPTVRTISEQTSHASFEVDISLYRDSSYSPGSLITSSPRLAQGEVLYVSVDMVSLSITDQQNQALVLDRCFATDTSSERRNVYDFIRNGCSTHPAFSTVIQSGESSRAKWSFRVFEWKTETNTNDIFIVCKVSVCDAGYESCLPVCSDSAVQPATHVGSIESNVTAENIELESMLNSLSVTGSEVELSNLNRSRREITDKTKKFPRRHGYLPNRNKQRRIASDSGFQVFVSKRISVLGPDAGFGEGFMQYPLRENDSKRNYLNSHNNEENEVSTCGLASFVMVGCASVVTYVLVAAVVKSLLTRMRR